MPDRRAGRDRREPTRRATGRACLRALCRALQSGGNESDARVYSAWARFTRRFSGGHPDGAMLQSITNMKRIGVLGGISPQATIDFEARVHRVCQQLVPQSWNRGYPPMVVWYHRRMPLRVDAD